MSNFLEYHDTIAFHPGYYIKEIVETSGLTQGDFAKRLDTTPKNLSLLVRGEQSLSIDIAVKLSRMMGTSVAYWLNLQNVYDSLIAEFKSEEELVKERNVFRYFDYNYFRDNHGLPDLPQKRDEQIKQVREFLNVATLSVFTRRDMAVNFRSSAKALSEENIVNANVMVQIAMNKALKMDAPKFSKSKFEDAVKYVLTLTKHHKGFCSLIQEAFFEAGVVFIILPDVPGSKTDGATKKIGDKIMLMVNDRKLSADCFWFTLFHEIGHIVNGDYGISFEKETGIQEEAADRYAEDSLIPPESYREFLTKGQFDLEALTAYAGQIERSPGIVLGRLQKDGIIRPEDQSMDQLRYKHT